MPSDSLLPLQVGFFTKYRVKNLSISEKKL